MVQRGVAGARVIPSLSPAREMAQGNRCPRRICRRSRPVMSGMRRSRMSNPARPSPTGAPSPSAHEIVIDDKDRRLFHLRPLELWRASTKVEVVATITLPARNHSYRQRIRDCGQLSAQHNQLQTGRKPVTIFNRIDQMFARYLASCASEVVCFATGAVSRKCQDHTTAVSNFL